MNTHTHKHTQLLLKAGRLAGGTHFVTLHSDEVLSLSLIEPKDIWWKALSSLSRGDSLTLPWFHLWKSLRYVRGDWLLERVGPRSLRFVDVAFRDDGKCSYLENERAYDGGSGGDDVGEEDMWRHGSDTRR